MNHRLVLSILAILCLSVFGGAQLLAQKMSKKEAIVWPADKIKWEEMKGGPPGIMFSNLWGRIDKGAYGALIKLPANMKNPLHTHSSTVKVVVLSGTFHYAPEGGAEQSLGAGSYLMVPGGLRHTSGTGDQGATVFQEGPGKFDMNVAGGAGEKK